MTLVIRIGSCYNSPMEIEEAVSLIREGIRRRPELKFHSWPNLRKDFDPACLHPMKGGCYIGTQALTVLVPEVTPWSQERNHFWGVFRGEIVDPTFDQFSPELLPLIYAEGKKTHFNKGICARSKELLREIDLLFG